MPRRPLTLRDPLALAVLLAALAAIGILLWRSAAPAQAVAAGEQRLLTFSGTGTAQIAPDSATIEAGVSALGDSADAAQDTASRKMNALIDHMKAQGIAADRLQTSDASVYEDWEHEGRFRASQSLTIRLADPSTAGTLMGEATQGGADTVSGPAFALDDQRAGYDEALRMAVADARAKADAAASQMDAAVGAVYAIEEGDASSAAPLVARTTALEVATDVPVEQGTEAVTLSVRVSFTYER